MTPEHRTLEVTDDLESQVLDIFKTMPQPVVVKPHMCGSSVGVTIARGGHDELLQGVYRAFEYSPKVMIEEYVRGREATCGVLEGYRGEELYSMLPIEIVPNKKNVFYDYAAKYEDESELICPGNFRAEEKDTLQRLAREVHETLGLRHYSRSDFIVSLRGIYFLEVNTLPGLTSHSLVPKALDAVGCSFSEFLDHLVLLALARK